MIVILSQAEVFVNRKWLPVSIKSKQITAISKIIKDYFALQEHTIKQSIAQQESLIHNVSDFIVSLKQF